jgi:hypothetical protein
MRPDQPPSDSRVPWLVVALAVLGAALIRARLLDVPLDRDEGEYAYMGRLLLEGSPPYARAWNMKFPGIYVVYALILGVFGPTVAAVRVGVAIATSGAIVLVFLLGRTLAGARVGAVAAVALAVLTVGHVFLGHAGYAEHFLLLPVLGGVLLLVRAVERRSAAWLFAAGAVLGLGIAVKQHALFFVAAAAIFAWREVGVRRATLVLAGATVPMAAVVTWLAAAGVLERFWFWTFAYAWKYATLTPAYLAMPYLLSALMDVAPAVAAPLALGALGLPALGRLEPRGRRLLILLACASVLAASVGFYFRRQYFLLTLPALAVLAGVATVWLADRVAAARGRAVGMAVAAAVLVAVLAQPLWVQRRVLFQLEPAAVAREIYGANPFTEAQVIGRHLGARMHASDRLAVIGSEPEIYFHAERPAATGYIYTYALMESHAYARAMQQEMIREIEAAAPAYVVFVNVEYSWLRTPASDPALIEWFIRYRDRHLEQVGLVELLSPTLTAYTWGEPARDRASRSPLFLTIYRRRAELTAR